MTAAMTLMPTSRRWNRVRAFPRDGILYSSERESTPAKQANPKKCGNLHNIMWSEKDQVQEAIYVMANLCANLARAQYPIFAQIPV